MNNGSENFFKAHYDWLVAGGGFLALAASAAFFLLGGPSASEVAAEAGAAGGGAKADIAPVDLKPFEDASRGVKSPAALQAVDPKKASFLASGYRVFCTAEDGLAAKKGCGRPIPYGAETCPYEDCGVTQPKKVKVAIDSDKDGIPNDFEVANGLNPNDPADAAGDLDGDGFSNLEEYQAKTKLNDPKDHPDYLDRLFVDGKLEATTLPVFFKGIYELGGGKFRYVFRDPTAKNSYGARGVDYTVDEGKEIGKTGFAPVAYEKKEERRKIKGAGAGETRTVDISTAKLVRAEDKKEIVVTVNQKNTPIDLEAHLVFKCGGEQKFTVSEGKRVTVKVGKNQFAFVVKSLAQDAAGNALVTVKPEPLGKEKIIKGLD